MLERGYQNDYRTRSVISLLSNKGCSLKEAKLITSTLEIEAAEICLFQVSSIRVRSLIESAPFQEKKKYKPRIVTELIRYVKIQGYSVTYIQELSKLILMAKIMRKNNFKTQMLDGNRLKFRVGTGFEISQTLVLSQWSYC